MDKKLEDARDLRNRRRSEARENSNLELLIPFSGVFSRLDVEGQPVALQLHLPRDVQKQGAFKNVYLDHYVIRHDEHADAQIKGWQSLRAIRPVELRSVHAGNQINLSLYEAAKQVRIPLKVLDEFVRVMSFSVDFQREVQAGDQFELVYDTAMDKLTGEMLTAAG